jgi:hypothetical protein
MSQLRGTRQPRLAREKLFAQTQDVVKRGSVLVNPVNFQWPD